MRTAAIRRVRLCEPSAVALVQSWHHCGCCGYKIHRDKATDETAGNLIALVGTRLTEHGLGEALLICTRPVSAVSPLR